MIDPLPIAELLLVVALVPWFGLLAAVLVAATVRHFGRDRDRDRAGVGGAGSDRPPSRFLVVIPAHDEAGVIGVTVASCRALAYPAERFQVFVIADNCGDETAAIAREAGANVVVRTDPGRKSKGFALEDFFRDAATHPAIRPFDAYVLVDADTSVAPDLLAAFDRSLRRGDDFIQGYYTVRNADVSWRTRLMTYAFGLANGVWLLGTDRLGLSVGLKGNGMCFRAAALDRFPWRAHGLVEDMEYAWAIRVAGGRVRFQPRAVVYGEMVSRGGDGAASQRQRWESGRRALRASVRANLWRSPHLGVLRKLVDQAELGFPPLSRLVACLGVASLLAAWGVSSSSHRSIWLACGAVIVAMWGTLGAYLMSPFVLMGLPVRYLLSLARLPQYMAWKLAIGLIRAPSQWVRTPREVATDETSKS